MSFFPGEAMSPDMQCFKDVVRYVPRFNYYIEK